MNRVILSLILLFFILVPAQLKGQQKKFRAEVELSPTWLSRADVRIPGDSGTKFSLSDFDNGPFFSYRLSLAYRFNQRHRLSALYAPFKASVSGVSSQEINFREEVFPINSSLSGVYKFNSYRLSYRYSFFKSNDLQMSVGFTAKIRDAKIALEDGLTLAANDKNIGFVPLLYFDLNYFFAENWRLVFQLEALAAPQGRAEDALLKVAYNLTDDLDIGLGYRMLEGGADNDKVYTFAWIHYLVFSLGYNF